jgi:hypothetical protein
VHLIMRGVNSIESRIDFPFPPAASITTSNSGPVVEERGEPALGGSRRRLDYNDVRAKVCKDPAREHRLGRRNFQHANVIEHERGSRSHLRG